MDGFMADIGALLSSGTSSIKGRGGISGASSANARKTEMNGSFSDDMRAARARLERADRDEASTDTTATAADATNSIRETKNDDVADTDEVETVGTETKDGDNSETIPLVNISAYHGYLSALAEERLFNRDNVDQYLTKTDNKIINAILNADSMKGIAGIDLITEYREREINIEEFIQGMYDEFIGDGRTAETGVLVEADSSKASQDASLAETLLGEFEAVESTEAERTVSTLQNIGEAAGDNAEYKSLNQNGEDAGNPIDKIIEVFTAQVDSSVKGTASAEQFIVNEAGEPVLPNEAAQQIMDGMLEQVETAVTESKSEMFIQLKPEVLGGLAIRLSMTEDGLSAQVRASNQGIQSVVNSQIAQLEDALRARGIEVVNIDVVYEQMANQQQMGEQRQQWYGSDNNSNSGSRQSYARIDDISGVPAENVYETMSSVADETSEDGVVYSA